MKIITLTHNQSGKKVVVNWNQALFAAETSSNLGEDYTEIAYDNGHAMPVKETADEITALLNQTSE
tara:strand:- start:503 stop:700 length:198 start_codon:yes stop_codon:yes gene_type:complete